MRKTIWFLVGIFTLVGCSKEGGGLNWLINGNEAETTQKTVSMQTMEPAEMDDLAGTEEPNSPVEPPILISPDPFGELDIRIAEKEAEIDMVDMEMDMLVSEINAALGRIDVLNDILTDVNTNIAGLNHQIGTLSSFPDLLMEAKMVLDRSTMLRDQILSDLDSLQDQLDGFSERAADLTNQQTTLNSELQALVDLRDSITTTP